MGIKQILISNLVSELRGNSEVIRRISEVHGNYGDETESWLLKYKAVLAEKNAEIYKKIVNLVED